MSWWLIILLGYLVVCWTIWIVILRIGLKAAAGEGDEGPCGELRRQQPGLYWLHVLLTTLVIGPLLPLFAAKCTFSAVRESRAWRKFMRTHRAALVEPIHPANVPQAGQEHFERCAPHLMRLGFVPAGTYLHKPEPLPVYLQCLLSRAGETVVDIALIGDGFSVSFVSVLENGHVLETGCSGSSLPDEELSAINASGRFTAQQLAGQFGESDLAAAYGKHTQLLRGLEQRFDCGTLHLAADQVPALKRYENAAFGEVLFSRGKVDNRPQSPQLPIGIARRISHASNRAASGVVLPAPTSAFGPAASPNYGAGGD